MLRNILKSGVVSARAWRKSKASTHDLPITRLPVGRNLPEKRSDITELGDTKSGKLHLILGSPSGSGMQVNEVSSCNVSVISACTALLAGMIGKLPIYLYQDTGNGPVEVKNHPAAWLVDKMPSEMHTPFELKNLMVTGECLGGNGYARVFRTATWEPRSIQWIAPCDITPRIVKRTNGETFPIYEITGQSEKFTRSEIIHVRWPISHNGLTGISPIAQMRESIGTSMAQTRAAGKLMSNGLRAPGMMMAQQILKKEQIEDARDEFHRNYSGVENSGRMPVVNGNFKFESTNGMTMVDAEFVESRRFELQEIARFYGIPTSLIGDTTNATSFGTGIEQMTLGFLNFCLDPHLKAWEQSLGITLLTTAEHRAGYYFRFDRDELANVALEARAAFYEKMRMTGVYSVNDIRAKMDEPLLTDEQGGNNYSLPFNNQGGVKAPVEPQPTI
jgi:HK97 family phage portal protein